MATHFDPAKGDWIPLMDYSMRKGVSLSTLRRHIKANKIQYKVAHGRYLLWDDGSNPVPAETMAYGQATTMQAHGKEKSDPRDEIQVRLQKAQEEIAELKTLIAFYEEQISAQQRFRNL